jgi:hypothetical protein
LETKNKTKRLVYPNDFKCLKNLLERKKQEITEIESDLEKASTFLTNIQALSQ